MLECLKGIPVLRETSITKIGDSVLWGFSVDLATGTVIIQCDDRLWFNPKEIDRLTSAMQMNLHGVRARCAKAGEN